MSQNTDIHLYTTGASNGIKVTILLEELGLSYQTTAISLSDNTRKEDWFLEINPNGKIPALTDKLADGTPIRVFESGSILQYITDRYDPDHKLSYPRGSKEYYEVNSWLHWQMSGLGPMQGQAIHFLRYASEEIPYGISRYQNETRRLYRVLDNALAKSTSGFIVGDRCTIADIASWCWVAAAKLARVDIEEFPNVKAWLFRLLERPGFERGRNIPTKHAAFEWAKLSEEELDAMSAGSKAWIQKSMKEDAAK